PSARLVDLSRPNHSADCSHHRLRVELEPDFHQRALRQRCPRADEDAAGRDVLGVLLHRLGHGRGSNPYDRLDLGASLIALVLHRLLLEGAHARRGARIARATATRMKSQRCDSAWALTTMTPVNPKVT